MLPIFLVVGLINILAQTKNYGIDIKDPEMEDIRVRRDVHMAGKIPDIFKNRYNSYLIRNKRQFSFFGLKPGKGVTSTPKYNTYTTMPRYSYNKSNELNWNFYTQNNGMLNKSYNLPNYNTGVYRYNGTGTNQTQHYMLQNTLMPKFNKHRYTGYKYNGTGYNQNPYYYGEPRYNTSEIPVYNYQDPTKSNFSGYFEHKFYIGNKTNNTTVKPYSPGYLPVPEFGGTKKTTTKHWYDNFNYTTTIKNQILVENGTETTTELQIACVICNTGCAIGYRRVSGRCIPDDY